MASEPKLTRSNGYGTLLLQAISKIVDHVQGQGVDSV